ncbi:peptide synthase, partial [Candidatus Magnetomorum sp. HK-1]
MNKSKAKPFTQYCFEDKRFDPNKTALIYPKNPMNPNNRQEINVSYGELFERSERCAAFLKKMGFQKGDRAVVFVDICKELYEIIFAINRLGGTLVYLDAWTDKYQFDIVCQTSEPKVFFAKGKAHILRLMIKACSKIPIKVVVQSKFSILYWAYNYEKEISSYLPDPG